MPIRIASSSIRRIRRPVSSGELAAPWRYSSAKPRIVVNGVRNSCDASAANWRIRSSDRTARPSDRCAARAAAFAVSADSRAAASDAARAANDVSICSSMTLSDFPSRPTSVRGSPSAISKSGTRWVRSPSAIAVAVRSISTSGRRFARTTAAPRPDRRISTITPPSSSITTSLCSVFATPVQRLPDVENLTVRRDRREDSPAHMSVDRFDRVRPGGRGMDAGHGGRKRRQIAAGWSLPIRRELGRHRLRT